jgi:hypothetical protein
MGHLDLDVFAECPDDEDDLRPYLKVPPPYFHDTERGESGGVVLFSATPHLRRDDDGKVLSVMVELEFETCAGAVSSRIVIDPKSALELADLIIRAAVAVKVPEPD